MIHAVGDSHVSVFTGLHGVCPFVGEDCPHAVPGFRVAHLGPYLAHSVARPRHDVREAIRKALTNTSAGIPVVFSFGEIDCRCHLAKHATSVKTIAAAAREVALAYARASAKLAGRREFAWLAAPPATVTPHLNRRYPTVGLFSQRRRAARAFNAALRRAAAEHGGRVLDLSDEFADANGAPRTEYFADGIHPDPRALPLFLRELAGFGWIKEDAPMFVAARALAQVPPPPSGGPSDPLVMERLLVEHAALRCRAIGARTIAIMGAGRHTLKIGLTPFEEAGLRVAAILDDAPGGPLLHGVPVRRPSPFPKGIDAIVVSSDAHERALAERARQASRGRAPVVTIYDRTLSDEVASPTMASTRARNPRRS